MLNLSICVNYYPKLLNCSVIFVHGQTEENTINRIVDKGKLKTKTKLKSGTF